MEADPEHGGDEGHLEMNDATSAKVALGTKAGNERSVPTHHVLLIPSNLFSLPLAPAAFGRG